MIFAVLAMLCVSAASVSAAHTHLKDAVDRCDICCTAHMASQQVAAIQIVHAPAQHSVLTPVSVTGRIEARGVLAFLTRGPPASL